MSKTIRRRNCDKQRYALVSWAFFCGKDIARIQHKYHGDGPSLVPSWFRRNLNRVYRAKVLSEVRASLKTECYDLVITPPRKTGYWLWW